MAKFIFKIQPVLKHRKRLEREKQRSVAVLERERVELETDLKQHQGLISDEKQALRDCLVGLQDGTRTGSFGLIRVQANASMSLVTKAQRLAIRLAGLHQRLGAARSELLEAMTARKAVEALKERQYEQWKAEQRKKEAAEQDEIAVMRGNRQENAA